MLLLYFISIPATRTRLSTKDNSELFNKDDSTRNKVAQRLFDWLELPFDPSYYTGQALYDKGHYCHRLCPHRPMTENDLKYSGEMRKYIKLAGRTNLRIV